MIIETERLILRPFLEGDAADGSADAASQDDGSGAE